MSNIVRSNLTAFKVVLAFSEIDDELDDFVAYNRIDAPSTEPKIISLNINKEGEDTNGDILGTVKGSTGNLEVFDASGNIYPGKMNSPYVNALIEGIPAYMYIADEIDDEEPAGSDAHWVWTPFGVWYTQSFGGYYADGYAGSVMISLQDKLTVYANKEIDFSNAVDDSLEFGGVDAKTLIENVCSTLGMSSSEYSIDSDFGNLSYGVFGVATGTGFGKFLNNICQDLMARAYVDETGVLHVVKWNYRNTSASHTWSISGEGNTPLAGLRTSKIASSMYSKVAVQYFKASDCTDNQVASKYIDVLQAGTVKSIPFNNRVMAITGVQLENNNRTSVISLDNIKYAGWPDGINIKVNSTADIEDVKVEVTGLVADQEPEETDEVAIDNTYETLVSKVFKYKVNRLMSDADAATLATTIAQYMHNMKYKYSLSDSVFNPKIAIGDTIVISNCSTAYNGTYKVIRVAIKIKNEFSAAVEMLKVS